MSADTQLSDIDLVQRFESLGDNCELGLVQRRVGAEPLGLLRFASAPLPRLVQALGARFEGLADPDAIQIAPMNDEYMVELTRYGFNYHADVKIGASDPAVLHAQQVRIVRFLTDKLIRDLENPDKILVFRQNEPLSANDLVDLRMAIAAYGPSTLLWVQEARPGYRAGTVMVADATLMIGYVSRLASRDDVPDLDLASWITMLRRADAARPVRTGKPEAADGPAMVWPGPVRPDRVDIAFGKEGNAAAMIGAGWSGQENGFCWSIDDSSELTLPPLGPADRYRLEMDVVPFISPPAVESQSLCVVVNGEAVQTFDPLPRGMVSCEIPGALLQGSEFVTIILEHPGATSPRQAAGQNDDRRLAISFRTLSLACA